MRFNDSTNAEGRAQLQEPLVLIGRIDEHTIAGLGAADDEHVVVHGSDDDGMDFVTSFGKEQRHFHILAGDWLRRGTAGSWEQSFASGSGRQGHPRSLTPETFARRCAASGLVRLELPPAANAATT